jgi:hypothetical protein
MILKKMTELELLTLAHTMIGVETVSLDDIAESEKNHVVCKVISEKIFGDLIFNGTECIYDNCGLGLSFCLSEGFTKNLTTEFSSQSVRNDYRPLSPIQIQFEEKLNVATKDFNKIFIHRVDSKHKISNEDIEYGEKLITKCYEIYSSLVEVLGVKKDVENNGARKIKMMSTMDIIAAELIFANIPCTPKALTERFNINYRYKDYEHHIWGDCNFEIGVEYLLHNREPHFLLQDLISFQKDVEGLNNSPTTTQNPNARLETKTKVIDRMVEINFDINKIAGEIVLGEWCGLEEKDVMNFLNSSFIEDYQANLLAKTLESNYIDIEQPRKINADENSLTFSI